MLNMEPYSYTCCPHTVTVQIDGREELRPLDYIDTTESPYRRVPVLYEGEHIEWALTGPIILRVK